MHPFLLLPAYMIVTILPLVLARVQNLPPRPVQDEIATGLAMVAFAILLVEFVLSGRFQLISRRTGMDVTMRIHQLLARTVLVFALLHPFLYSTPFGRPLPWDATGQLTLGLDAGSLATGLIAWVALPVMVLTAIFRDQLPYRYETWRLMHGLGAILIGGAVTHHVLVAGRYSADPLLAGFWVLLLAAALASLLHTYVINPLRQIGKPFEVVSVRPLALKTWELSIRPRRGDALRFDSGQFVWLNLVHSPFSLYENPFSISSTPGMRPVVQFVIKEVGDMTRHIGDVAPETTAYLDGPHGNLTLKGRSGKGIALIAGGVGVAPLLSIARDLYEEDDQRPMILLYGNRVVEQIIYQDELDRLAERENTNVIHVLSEPPKDWLGLTGYVGREAIETVFGFPDARDWLYLVCGPPAMLEIVEASLIERGIPPRQIVSEQFYYD